MERTSMVISLSEKHLEDFNHIFMDDDVKELHALNKSLTFTRGNTGEFINTKTCENYFS